MLAAVVLAALGVERDHRQQLLGVGEHLLLDHVAQLLVAHPARVAAIVVGAGAQHEVDHLVAEILGVGNARRLFDFFQLFVERLTVENLAGVRVAELLILNPEIRVHHVAIENVLTVFGVGFQVGGLNLLADEFHIVRHQVFLDEAAVLFLQLLGELFLLDALFQHMHQVHRVGRHFGMVEVEHLGENLERETGGEPVHALVDPGHVAVFLHRLGARVHVLQVFAVVDPHLGIDAGILRLLEAREHRELGQHAQGVRRAVRFAQAGVAQQLVVDLLLLGDSQAIRHLDDEHAVDKGFVVLVVAEGLPLGFVGVRQHDAVERNRAHVLGAVVVALLGGGEQRMQHLDRRLEHFHELEQALVGPAQAAGKAVGVRVFLGEFLQLADVHLAHQGRDVLVVFVAGLGLGHRHLVENRRVAAHHAELAQVAAVVLQPLHRPGRHDGAYIAARNAVLLFQDRAVLFRVEQAQRRFVHRRILDGVERHLLHERLELFRQ